MIARSLLLVAPRHLDWIEENLPDPGPGHVLVKTVAGAISIGTELPHYRGTSRGIERRFPSMTGYESVGRVLQCGPDVDHLVPGDRIVSFYGHRTHSTVPVDKAIPVPPNVSDELAILAILSCDAAKGIRKLTPRPHDRVLVTGGGTIGLLALWTLRAYGVETVDLVEPDDGRRELARRIGTTHVFASDQTHRIPGDYAFGVECSSRDAAFAVLQRSMRPDGSICVLADGNLEPLTLTPDFHRKELHVVGSSDGWDYFAHARWFFERARQDEDLLTSLFQWRISSQELIETFDRLATANPRPVKVFVDYGQE